MSDEAMLRKTVKQMVEEEIVKVKVPLDTILLDDIAGMLADISFEIANFRQEWKATLPKGKVNPLEFSVTEKFIKLTPAEVSSMPWVTFDVFNDGPDGVYVIVNQDYVTKKAPLKKDENLTVDMKRPIIEKVYLFCGTGKKASVRIYPLK